MQVAAAVGSPVPQQGHGDRGEVPERVCIKRPPERREVEQLGKRRRRGRRGGGGRGGRHGKVRQNRPSERASQEEQNGANFSSVAPSSKVRLACIQQACNYTYSRVDMKGIELQIHTE